MQTLPLQSSHTPLAALQPPDTTVGQELGRPTNTHTYALPNKQQHAQPSVYGEGTQHEKRAGQLSSSCLTLSSQVTQAKNSIQFSCSLAPHEHQDRPSNPPPLPRHSQCNLMKRADITSNTKPSCSLFLFSSSHLFFPCLPRSGSFVGFPTTSAQPVAVLCFPAWICNPSIPTAAHLFLSPPSLSPLSHSLSPCSVFSSPPLHLPS